MAELIGKNGTWSFDGDVVRIVPGHDKEVSRLRTALGEIAVPLAALTGVAFEAASDAGKKAKNGAGRIRLRLRAGADPLLQACGGRLSDEADPYQLLVPPERGGVAEYFADEVRDSLTVAQVPADPTDRYLIASPPVPISANGQDGTGSFDGETVRLEWGWMADGKKRSAGNRTWPLTALEAVEWRPAVGMDWGWIRFRIPRGRRDRQHQPAAGPELPGFVGHEEGEREQRRAGRRDRGADGAPERPLRWSRRPGSAPRWPVRITTRCCDGCGELGICIATGCSRMRSSRRRSRLC